jgi:hypothetical protein
MLLHADSVIKAQHSSAAKDDLFRVGREIERIDALFEARSLRHTLFRLGRKDAHLVGSRPSCCKQFTVSGKLRSVHQTGLG